MFIINSFKIPTLLTLIALPWFSDSKTITFAVDDYCPYYCKDSNSPHGKFSNKPGFIIEILNEAFLTLDVDVKYTFLPWERGITEVHKNSINGIIIASKSNAPDLIYPEQEQASSIGCFVTQTNNPWRYSSKQSLKNMRLGVIQGYDYGEPVDSFIWEHYQPDNNIAIIAGERALPRLLHMLVKKRIDTVIEDKNVLLHSIKANDLEQQLVLANCTQSRVSLYVAFSPKNPESKRYAKIVSNAMTTLRESGELARILAKYNIVDWL
jgi:polar amino acid transport system substrate-binding protein